VYIRYQLWLKFDDHEDQVIEDVEEFEPGFNYFYVRCYDGKTRSFPREHLASVKRRTGPEKGWLPVIIRKPKIDYGSHVEHHEEIREAKETR